MPEKERKISIDVLMEGTGGELVFKEIKASRKDLKELAEADRNPVIKHNVFKTGTGKKVRV